MAQYSLFVLKVSLKETLTNQPTTTSQAHHAGTEVPIMGFFGVYACSKQGQQQEICAQRKTLLSEALAKDKKCFTKGKLYICLLKQL